MVPQRYSDGSTGCLRSTHMFLEIQLPRLLLQGSDSADAGVEFAKNLSFYKVPTDSDA